MSSNEIVKDVAEGATLGFLDWGEGKVKHFVERLRNRKLGFIKEEKTRETVREEYLSGESKFYKQFVKDKKLLFLIRLGLGLRKLENDADRLANLRDYIFKEKYLSGLHVAEFVQNGVLNHYMGLLISGLKSINDLTVEVENILNNIDKHVIFVQQFDRIDTIIKKTITIIDAHSPKIFIISGAKSAQKIIIKCQSQLKTLLDGRGYKLTKVGYEDKEILFFQKTIS